MKKTKILAGLSPNQERIMSILEYKKTEIVTRAELINLIKKYTKIKINPPSKYLTQDLWMTISTPTKIKIADFANRFGFWYGLFFFIVCSCLASLISGTIVFRKDYPSKFKFLIFGLFNFLTLNL